MGDCVTNKAKVRRIVLRNGKGVRYDKPSSIRFDSCGAFRWNGDSIRLWYLEWDDGEKATLNPTEYREWTSLCETIGGLLERYP